MNRTNDQLLPVSYADVAAAAATLEGIAHRTPALTSRTVDERTGAQGVLLNARTCSAWARQVAAYVQMVSNHAEICIAN